MKYLPDCLSFLKRSRTWNSGQNELLAPRHEFDTIVVDNGSDDGSVEFIRSEFPHVKVLSFSENTGFSKAVNAGIETAKTPYVILLNNDTKVDTYFVSKLENAMEKKVGYFSLGAKMLSMSEPEIIDDAGDLYCSLGWAFALGKGKSTAFYEKDYDVFAACAGAAIYRKEIFERIGLFDEAHFAYLEDIDVGYRALIHGYRNGFVHDALVYHAGSGSSGSRYNKFKVELSSRNSIYLVYKNMPFLQVLINLPFLIPGFLVKTLFFAKKGFGVTYMKGIFKGFRMCFGKAARTHKVRVKGANVGNYLKIQGLLWINTVRRMIG